MKGIQREVRDRSENKKELLRKIRQIEEEKGTVTLLYAARNKEYNNAIILSSALNSA